MISVLVSRLSSPGSSPSCGHCVVFLGKTLNSRSASLYPGTEMGTSELNAGGNPVMDWHPIQGGVEILLVASCYGNWDKLQKAHLLFFVLSNKDGLKLLSEILFTTCFPAVPLEVDWVFCCIHDFLLICSTKRAKNYQQNMKESQ